MVYSYHTFYFPFIWRSTEKIELKTVVKALAADWKDISLEKYEQLKEVGQGNYSYVADYQSVQYFTPAARRSMFGWGENFVKCLEYKFAKGSEYHIKQGNDIWNLYIDGIRLKIYNTGIGVLSIETENHNYKTLKDVKAINEYGRRIFAPYFNNEGICDSCADELGIKGVSFDMISSVKPENEARCVPGFIRNLFPENMSIIPAIDDRMFVACLLNDGQTFEELMHYKDDEAASKSLYEFIYIDRDDYCTCPTNDMREELLDSSIYRRWIEYTAGGKPGGTIYGITNHSFMCVTACTLEYIIERPFLIIYNHMVSSVIAQRATILAFDKIVSELSSGFEKKHRNMKKKKIRKLQKLQERYIAFLNQHMNIEVTNQEQGIELYRMFQKELYIKEEMENLEKEINAMSEAADTRNDWRLNKWAIIISVLIVFVEPITAPIMTAFAKFVWSLGLDDIWSKIVELICK